MDHISAVISGRNTTKVLTESFCKDTSYGYIKSLVLINWLPWQPEKY